MQDCSIPIRDLNSVIHGFRSIFNLGLGLPHPIANDGAHYYILLINYFPTTFKDIVKKANELSPGLSRADLISGKEELLKAGIIAEILPTLDQETKDFRKNFRRETIFPVSPNVLWDVYSNKIEKILDLTQYASGLEEIYNKCYLKKFDFGKIKDRIHKCHPYANDNSIDCLTMYFSGMWVIYSLLEIAKNTKTLSIMLSGKRSMVAPQVSFYEKLIDQGVSIKAILDERYRDVSTGSLSQSPIAEVKYNQTHNQGTRRITIADDLFALDGRKLLPFSRPDPSYIATIYFNQNSIRTIQDIFDAIWRSLNI
jgi:hypothetical protein